MIARRLPFVTVIDLRSDTVTRPVPAMWEAMRCAELGDDVLGDEPTVAALEAKVAALLGKDAALFTPSGTMANQLAIRGACESGDEVLAHRDSHIVHYETGAPAAISGCMIAPLDGDGGLFGVADVHRAIRGGDIHSPRSRMVVLENTHNRGGGTIWPLARVQEISDAAREAGLHLHVDGARLANAAVAGGYSMRDVASRADTVSICFSKGLGCPVGSALAGPRAFIERCRRFRKMLGGGMRQSGVLAAAAIWALDHHVDRLAEDHANAKRLARALVGVPGFKLELEPDSIPTNMVFFAVSPEHGTAREVAARLAERGVRLIPMGPQRLRAVTHLDVDAKAIDRAAALIRESLPAATPGTAAKATAPSARSASAGMSAPIDRSSRSASPPQTQALAAIFDLDGTLFDTFDEHHSAWSDACREQGIPLSREQFAWSFGRRNEEIIPEIWRAAGRAAPSAAELERLSRRKEELFRERFIASPRPIAGSESLLRELRAAGWRLGAGSSAPPTNVQAFVRAMPTRISFDATVSGADVTHGKPHPEVFLRAAERLGIEPSRAIVFEDAAPGVEAAHRAGMRCVAIVSPGRTREELRRADLIVDDFTTLTPAVLHALLETNACQDSPSSPALPHSR